jgi:uncharacterized protein
MRVSEPETQNGRNGRARLISAEDGL